VIAKRPINLIGRGRIGAAVADWLNGSDSHVLQSVIGRTGTWRPAPLAIDAAGPQALRAHGQALLSEGDLWSVGAAALIDDDLRGRLAEVAGRTGHELRLFTGWIAGPTLAPAGAGARLHIEQHAPRLGPASGLLFSGSLREAVVCFPEHLNTAMAAALAGPGIDATTIALHCSEEGGPHVIRARFEVPGQTIQTNVQFDGGPHPVAQAIIAALEARGRWLRYG
jgi:predicted dinucleotide-utilizing enzyme